METKKNRPPNLSLKPEKDGKTDESSGSPDCNANIQSLKEMDKLGNLKVPVSPLSKRWFRKQFGIRKDGARLQDDGAKLQTPINNADAEKEKEWVWMSKMFIGCMTKLKTVNSIFKMERPSVASENVCF